MGFLEYTDVRAVYCLLNWNTSDLLTEEFRPLVFQDMMLKADIRRVQIGEERMVPQTPHRKWHPDTDQAGRIHSQS